MGTVSRFIIRNVFFDDVMQINNGTDQMPSFKIGITGGMRIKSFLTSKRDISVMRQIIHQQMKHNIGCAFMFRRRLNKAIDGVSMVGADSGMDCQ